MNMLVILKLGYEFLLGSKFLIILGNSFKIFWSLSDIYLYVKVSSRLYSFWLLAIAFLAFHIFTYEVAPTLLNNGPMLYGDTFFTFGFGSPSAGGSG